MKKLILLFVFVYVAYNANAQVITSSDDSARNYKHFPVAIVPAMESTVATSSDAVSTVGENYKIQSQEIPSGDVPVVTAPIEVNVNSVFSNQNYKAQNSVYRKTKKR